MNSLETIDLGGFKTVLQNAIVPLLESVDNEDQKMPLKISGMNTASTI